MVYFKNFWMEQWSRLANISFSEPLSLRPWCWCAHLGGAGNSRSKIYSICTSLDNHWYLDWCTMSRKQVWKMTSKKCKTCRAFSPLNLKDGEKYIVFPSPGSQTPEVFSLPPVGATTEQDLWFLSENWDTIYCASKRTTKYFQIWDLNQIW